MIVKRITPNKIKLGVHTDTLNTRYRFYSVANDVVVWFNYMYQANTYYSNDVLYIDVNKSQIITNETYQTPYIVVIRANAYNTYKLLNGKLMTRDAIRQDEENNGAQYLILEDNNNLYPKIQQKIKVIRALHTESPLDFTLWTPIRDEYQLLTRFNPNDGHQDRNTRPYHHRTLFEIRNGAQTTTSTTTTTTTTDTTTSYRNLIAGYHSGVNLNDRQLVDESETATGTTRYFGIELETELDDYNRLAEYTTKINDLINNGELGKYVKFERDGSLRNYGCELIFRALTPKLWHTRRPIMKQLMDLINELGGTSHDNGRCGLHIHVSRASLTEDAINQIYFVVETFKKELITFSRRQSFNYCAFHNFSESTIQNGYKYIDKDFFIRNKTIGHYTCLNNGNTHTLEFRFFRGTTNIQTFMASIELVDNICNMVMNGDMKNGTTWLDIINYNDEYEDLKRYNERRNITSTKEYKEILDLSRSDR